VLAALRRLRLTDPEIAETLEMATSTVSAVLGRIGLGKLGKAERFIRTMLREWAYAAVYGSSPDRAAALSGWLERYNFRRRHGALGHRPPIERLRELTGNNVAGIYT
jgi:hypothetical protein